MRKLRHGEDNLSMVTQVASSTAEFKPKVLTQRHYCTLIKLEKQAWSRSCRLGTSQEDICISLKGNTKTLKAV